MTQRFPQVLQLPDAQVGTSTQLPMNTPEQNLASNFYLQLKMLIIDFNRSLNPEEETGLRLVSFGQSMTLHIDRLGFSNPSLIIFGGVTDDGSPVTLVQHVSQINCLLMALHKPEPEKPARPIGFLGDIDESPPP